jgi:hypothetical protein
VVKYKEKGCSLCGQKYIPTSPKQKYCSAEGRRIGSRERDRCRSRKKYNYTEYTRNCKHCGIEFKTYYKKKVYCGAKECDQVRLYLKNQRIQDRRPKEYMIEKGHRYYKENKERILIEKSIKYRELNPDAIPYVGGKPAKLTYGFVKEYVEGRGYELLSKEYTSNKQKLLLKCPHGHEWETTLHGFKDAGTNCFWCYIENNYTSKFEGSVREYINKIYSGSIIYNDRTQIMSTITGCRLELDIWFPDLYKAIECNGVYWHSDEDNVKRDQLKVELCYQKGIDLLVITDDDWELETGRETILNFVKEKGYENLLG